jgi:uncharacterized protein (TIGR02246 family)
MHVRLMVPMLAFFSLGIAWNDGCADEQAANRNPDEVAIRKTAAQYMEALKRGDAPALVAAWTADGDYVDSNGSVFKAHDLIKKQFPAGSVAREREPREIAIPLSTIRFITGDVAIEDGVSQVRSAGDEGARVGRYTVVWKKRGGRWLVDSVREASVPPANAANAPSPADARLTDLAWLIGDWTGRSSKMAYEISASFLEGERVLELKSTVLVDNRRVLVGTEYITRETATGAIKSCAIDSAGGHGEGRWTVDENIWTVDTMGALADGKMLESTNVYTPHDDGTVTWSVLDVKVDGQEVPDVSVKFSRKPAK